MRACSLLVDVECGPVEVGSDHVRNQHTLLSERPNEKTGNCASMLGIELRPNRARSDILSVRSFLFFI